MGVRSGEAIFGLLTLLMFSIPGCEDTGLAPKYVNFYAMSVGQQSKFVRFAGIDYFSSSGAGVSYQPDTLLLEVSAQQGNGFILSERFNSRLVTYLLMQSAESFTILRADTLYGNDPQIFPVWVGKPLTLANRSTSQEIYLVGRHTSVEPCECNAEGSIADYTHLGRQFGRVNVLVKNWGMRGDGPGYTVIYSPTAGIIRSSAVSPWPPNEARGWSILP